MFMAKATFVVLFACIISQCALAGPFGLEMGMQVEKLPNVTASKRPFTFDSKQVPQPHALFSDFTLVATPEHGLCKILAFSGPIRTSAYGSEARDAFAGIEKALQQKYGAGEQFQFLPHDSIWKDDRYWMMGLLKKEREHSTFWKQPANTDHIQAISLKAAAINAESIVLTLNYEFENFSPCLELIRAKANSPL